MSFIALVLITLYIIWLNLKAIESKETKSVAEMVLFVIKTLGVIFLIILVTHTVGG